jgi:hypothetical protein
MGFDIEGDVFAHLLHGAADEHFPGDLNSDQLGRVDAPLYGIELVNIETDGPIRKTEGIE